MKSSLFNQFFEYENKVVLGYNSKTRGLLELDSSEYELYKNLAEGIMPDVADEDSLRVFIDELSRGNFLVENDMDELQQIKAAYHLSRFLSQSASLTIVVTHKCNLACDYCYEERQPYSMANRHIPGLAKLFKGLLDRRRAKSFGVTWYGGEPLLKPTFIANFSKRMITYCEKKNIDYSAGIITNGTLLTRGNAKMLKDCRVTHAQVTIDGPREIHDSRRKSASGKGTFDLIINNLKHAYDLVRINVRVNVDMNNADTAIEVLNVLDNAGLKRKVKVHFAPVQPYTEKCSAIAHQCYSKEAFSELEVSLMAESMNKGFIVDKAACLPKSTTVNCGAVSISSFVIDAKGKFHKCYNTVGDDSEALIGIFPREINGNESRGNESFYFESTKDNASKWIAFDPFVYEKCRRCHMLPSCMGGCPYPAVVQGLEPKCPTWKYNIKERMWIYRNALLAEEKLDSAADQQASDRKR